MIRLSKTRLRGCLNRHLNASRDGKTFADERRGTDTLKLLESLLHFLKIHITKLEFHLKMLQSLYWKLKMFQISVPFFISSFFSPCWDFLFLAKLLFVFSLVLCCVQHICNWPFKYFNNQWLPWNPRCQVIPTSFPSFPLSFDCLLFEIFQVGGMTCDFQLKLRPFRNCAARLWILFNPSILAEQKINQ